jgi:hypothetical protein
VAQETMTAKRMSGGRRVACCGGLDLIIKEIVNDKGRERREERILIKIYTLINERWDCNPLGRHHEIKTNTTFVLLLLLLLNGQ